MAAAWEERFGKLDRAAEALEKIVAIDSRNYSAYRELARLYQQAGKYEALVETYRNHIMATTDVATRIELYVAMGQVYEQRAAATSTARSRRTTTSLSFDADEPRALDALGRLYEKISEWDRAIDVDGAPRPADDRRRAAGRPVLADGHASSTTSSATPSGAEANLLRGARARSRPRADDGGADQAVLGSR